MNLTDEVPNGAVTGVEAHAQSAAIIQIDTDDSDDVVSISEYTGLTLASFATRRGFHTLRHNDLKTT